MTHAANLKKNYHQQDPEEHYQMEVILKLIKSFSINYWKIIVINVITIWESFQYKDMIMTV